MIKNEQLKKLGILKILNFLNINLIEGLPNKTTLLNINYFELYYYR